jgi:hypothetical protein
MLVPFAISWFQLWSTLRKLKFDHLLAPQSRLTVDLVISVVPLDQWLRSVSFSTDHALLDLHDLSTRGLFKSTVAIFFATPGFGDFNSQTSRSPKTILSGVHRLLPCVLLKSMALVCFGTLTLSTKTRSMALGTLLDQRSRFTSGLRRFHSLLSSGVFHTWSSGSDATHPPRINDPRSLPDFGLQEFQLLYTRFLLECFTRIPRSNDACLSFDRMVSIHFGASTFQASGVSILN